MTPKESGGVATLDISDPLNPVRLASTTTDKAYIGMFHRRYVFFIGLKAFDVLSNPKSIASIGSLPTEGSEYMSFQDDYMFLGHVRTEIGGTPGASKITVADPRSMRVTSRIWGRLTGDKNDDQFTIPIGNLLVIGDDQIALCGLGDRRPSGRARQQAAGDRHGHPRQQRDRRLRRSRGSGSPSRTTSSSRPSTAPASSSVPWAGSRCRANTACG